MSVNKENYFRIQEQLLAHKATLVAVSKKKTAADIRELFEMGHRDFGENYVQELVEKHSECPSKVRWHFIGHLQSNKVKTILPMVHLIHGVDSVKLLAEINKQAKTAGVVAECLLQVHIANEETKFGFSETEVEALMLFPELSEMNNVLIRGLMGMASLTDNTAQIKKEFTGLKNLFDNCRLMALEPRAFNTLSMGMSSDYELALECGSNMVRIGSAIFGERT